MPNPTIFSNIYACIYKLLYYPIGTITFLVTIHQVCVWISGKYELSTLVACHFFSYVSWLLGVNMVGFNFFFSFFLFFPYFLFIFSPLSL